MYRYFDSLPHPSRLQALGIVVAQQENKRLGSRRYPDGRFIIRRGDRAGIDLDIAVPGYEDGRKSSESGCRSLPEAGAVIPQEKSSAILPFKPGNPSRTSRRTSLLPCLIRVLAFSGGPGLFRDRRYGLLDGSPASRGTLTGQISPFWH